MASMWLVSSFSFSFPFPLFYFFLCSYFWTLYLICLLFFLVVHFSSFLSFLIFSPFFFFFYFILLFISPSFIPSTFLYLSFFFCLPSIYLSFILLSHSLSLPGKSCGPRSRLSPASVRSTPTIPYHHTRHTSRFASCRHHGSSKTPNTYFPPKAEISKASATKASTWKKQEEKFYPGNPVEIKGIIQGGEKSESNQKKPE